MGENSNVFFFVLAALGIFLLAKKISYKKNSNNDEVLKILKSLDSKNSKEYAYNFTKIGRTLELSEREKRIFGEIVDDLKVYKYCQYPNALDQKTIAKIEVFLGVFE